jgi:hypothetical protein
MQGFYRVVKRLIFDTPVSLFLSLFIFFFFTINRVANLYRAI